jgi:hypothetical protein
MAKPPADTHPHHMDFAIAPETQLEQQLLVVPRLRRGLAWGRPRPGHPEGRVADHVAAILTGIPNDDPLRSDLRFLALTHDSFKAEVHPDEPWSPGNDHARLARRFAERYTSDERLLMTLELHDEPYWIWRTHDAPEQQLRQLLDRLPDRELFARFVELDAANEGKDLTFLWWFRRELAIAGELPTHPATLTQGQRDEVVYLKAFATTPQHQAALARAADEVLAEQQARMPIDGEVMTSDDGQRVLMLWRWQGTRRELIERDEELIRDALAAHPIFRQAKPVEARVFHATTSR